MTGHVHSQSRTHRTSLTVARACHRQYQKCTVPMNCTSTAVNVLQTAQQQNRRMDLLVSRRTALTAATALLACSTIGIPAWAAAETGTAAATATAATDPSKIPVYFGNGCFWGRQKDFVDVEMAMGRVPGQISAVVGYAGGKATSSDGKVCYYYANKDSVYERLGHAEVVQLELDTGSNMDTAKRQMQTLAETYFKQFNRTPFGMQRLDPQDAGPGYRNVVGLPGGVDSPLFPVFAAQNKNNMKLVRGDGNAFVGGKPTEDDKMNTVYILDSTVLPFYRAEQYHQYHNGLGKSFPKEYLQDMKKQAVQSGKIGPTGCPEYYFMQ